MAYDAWKLDSPPEPDPYRCIHCGEWDEECDCEDGPAGSPYTREDYEADRADMMHSDGEI